MTQIRRDLSTVLNLAIISALLVSLIGGATRPALAVELGVQGSCFTLDGKPTFLLGMSYYGGLGASPETVKADLDRLKELGFNWIRVWATWSAFDSNVSAVDADGNARKSYINRLGRLIAECDRRRMVVDVTLTRQGPEVPGSLRSDAAHERAVRTLVTTLRSRRNWYLDIANERNIRDSRYVSKEAVGTLAEVVRSIDPKRLLTASQGGEISREELGEYLTVAHVDFVCPHRTRDEGSAQQTEAKTRELLQWMKELGKVIPVHYQEPFRRGYAGWNPRVADYLADLEGAKRGGAAGWCLHNGSERGVEGGEPRRSFDLSRKRLFEQLDAVELEVARRVGKSVK